MLIHFTTQHQLQNTRKTMCVKNCAVSTIFDGFQPTCVLAPQPIYQRAKQNVFKFLNAKYVGHFKRNAHFGNTA